MRNVKIKKKLKGKFFRGPKKSAKSSRKRIRIGAKWRTFFKHYFLFSYIIKIHIKSFLNFNYELLININVLL